MESAFTIEQKCTESIAIEPVSIYLDDNNRFEDSEFEIEYGEHTLILDLYVKVELEHTPATYFTPEFHDIKSQSIEIFSIRMEDEDCMEIHLPESEKEELINQIKNSITIK